jgi:hypothetical protein
MSIKNALTALISDDKPKEGNEIIEHGFLTSSRFLVMVAMVGLLLWLVLKGLTAPIVVIPICAIAALYLITNTVTRVYQIKANAEIIKERQRLAWADGQLTADEAAALKAADDKATSVGSVVGTK